MFKMNGTAVQISGYVSLVGPIIFCDVELRLVNIPCTLGVLALKSVILQQLICDIFRHFRLKIVMLRIQVLQTKEISVLQHGRSCVLEASEALVSFRHCVPFVAARQRAAEEPGHSARLDTVSHSKQKTGVAGKLGASDWRRSC